MSSHTPDSREDDVNNEEGSQTSDSYTVNIPVISNGSADTSECHSVNSADSLDDNCDSSDKLSNERPDIPNASQAYGGARPKTTRSSDRNKSKNGELKVRVVEENGIDIPAPVKHYETDIVSRPRTISSDEIQNHYNLPRLESRPICDKSKRLSNPDISKEDLNEPDIMEEDCYIYTYKGGTAYLSADLPNSFFRLDSGSDGESLPGVAGAGQSNLSTGVAALIQDQLMNHPQVRSFSPEQDFIEMDFDPGSESDGGSSSDSGQGMDGTDMEGEDREALVADDAMSSQEDGFREREGNITPNAQHSIFVEPILVPHNNNIISKSDEICKNCEIDQNQLSPATLHDQNLYLADLQEPQHANSAPVLSPAEEVPVLMPRSKSLNSSLGDCLIMSSDPPVRIANLSLCGSRLLQREALIFSNDGDCINTSLPSASSPSDKDVSEDLFKLSVAERLPNSVTQKAMIWTEKEAIRKQVTQLPNSSSCGATALVNVLLALEVDVDLHHAAEAVHTKLRRLDAPLPDYLLSRSMAGCTHNDLISAVRKTVPQVKARFFPFYNRTFQLASLLADWIARGLVPILTLNVQRSRVGADGGILDSWHHQMVWGVSGHEIYLANPLEMVSEKHLNDQISSPSELLIRRTDIVSRFHSKLDLGEINELGHRWREMNVLGQVVNIMREARSAEKDESVTLTSHVRIPASYSSGVTLFCSADNEEGLTFLKESPDLPDNNNDGA